MKPSGLEFFFWGGGFLTIVSMSVLVMGLFTLSISSWFSLRRLYESFNLSISICLLGCPVCWCIHSYAILYNLLSFYGICCYFSLLFSDFIKYLFVNILCDKTENTCKALLLLFWSIKIVLRQKHLGDYLNSRLKYPLFSWNTTLTWKNNRQSVVIQS